MIASQESLKDRYDCVVMGAGPGGCTAATIVADAGYSTLLVEREEVPRFHVGESLMPEIYWTLERLGLVDQMEQEGFVRKVGVQFVSSNGRESAPFFFRLHDDRESSDTWHVERGRFDKMLFDNAARKGVDCFDRTRVLDVELDDSATPQHRVKLQVGREEARTVSTRVVVDATGQSALLANRLGLMEVNQKLKKAAIWSYFKGAERLPEGQNMTTILHTCDKSAWFWYIPLSNDVVSVGVVSDHAYLLDRKRGTPEAIFQSELERCEAVKSRVASARVEGKYHVAKEFSYTTTQHAGPGWVLVGDAFGFIDPIYSSGVYLALKSGEAAGDAIVSGFESGDLSGQRLGQWADDYKRGAELIRRLVHAYYTNEFSFGAFMKEYPEHQGRLTDLLIGRVFGGDVAQIFDDMDPALKKVIEMADHATDKDSTTTADNTTCDDTTCDDTTDDTQLNS